MAQINYLLVDDEERIIELLQGFVERRLKESHYKGAANGKEALKYTSLEKFDFIITDFYMPELNGIDFIHQLRQMEGPNQNTPIILLSAYNPNLIASHNSNKDRPSNWESVFFMDKPINMTQLDHYLTCCIKLREIA